MCGVGFAYLANDIRETPRKHQAIVKKCWCVFVLVENSVSIYFVALDSVSHGTLMFECGEAGWHAWDIHWKEVLVVHIISG